MKVAIIVYSLSADAVSAGKKIADELRQQTDIEVDLKPLRPARGEEALKEIQEDYAEYDLLLMGGPASFFDVNKLFIKHVDNLPALRGKKFFPFITSSMLSIFGAKRALSSLEESLESTFADVEPGVVVGGDTAITRIVEVVIGR